MDFRGQISAEYILMVGFMLIIVLVVASSLGEQNELNIAMAAARSGAEEGANMGSFAIYPEDTFSNYTSGKPRLLTPSSIKIRRMNYTNQGFNLTYNRTRIQIRIYASAPSVSSASDRNSIGDRINFYARKSICEAFGTCNLTNNLFNPAFSNRYVFTTTDVQWV